MNDKTPVVVNEESFIELEEKRQQKNIELIASENFASDAVLKALSSPFNAKYCEGYPERSSIDKFIEMFPEYHHTGNIGRYYGGCEPADMVELYARLQFQKAFHTNYHVNVQPHSGSQANMAAYAAVLKPWDVILSMDMSAGAHLTHSSPVSFVSELYNVITYGLTKDGEIDYDDIEFKVAMDKPNLVVLGASAYPREIDFEKAVQKIQDGALIANELISQWNESHPMHKQEEYKPYIMVDMAHIAGLIATGLHSDPFAAGVDIVTTTTHKTLRGPRGGVIFCKPELAKKVDSAVFPHTQGGPLMSVIAAKGICAEEAQTEEYHGYMTRVRDNCKIMADEFVKMGYDVMTNGTDNHLFVVDLRKNHSNITGYDVQKACDAHNITLNKNMVNGDTRSPKETSGIRIGTAAMTSKGYTADDFINVAHEINEIICAIDKA